MNVNYTPDVGAAVVAQGLFNWPLPVVTAGTAIAETPIDMQGSNAAAALSAVYIVPGSNVAASNTNYATIQIFKRTNGGSQTLLAVGTTQVSGTNALGNLTAFTPAKLVLQSGAFLSASDVVTVTVTHTGTGASITQTSQIVAYQTAQ